MLRLSQLLEVINEGARIRIIRGRRGNREPQFEPGNKILFCNYKCMLSYSDDATAFLADDPQVKEIVFNQEIRHKEYRERGLFPPYEPELTREYEFKDLTVFLYYDVYI